MQALETAELVSRLGSDQLIILAGDFNSAPGELSIGVIGVTFPPY